MNFRAFLCRSCRWQYFLWFQLFIGVLALYPVFIVFFGVTGGAAFGLLIGVLCFRRPSAANLSLRRKAGVGFLVAGAAVFLVNLMSGIYIRAAGFRGNEFLSDIAYLWIPGYLCFAAIPFLFSVVPRRFRFAAILFAAAWGGILLIVEPFYWGEFPVDEKWSVPVAVQNNFPVPLRKGGEPPKRFLAVVGTELAIIPVDQLSSLSCNNTMGGRAAICAWRTERPEPFPTKPPAAVMRYRFGLTLFFTRMRQPFRMNSGFRQRPSIRRSLPEG